MTRRYLHTPTRSPILNNGKRQPMVEHLNLIVDLARTIQRYDDEFALSRDMTLWDHIQRLSTLYSTERIAFLDEYTPKGAS